MDDRELLSQTGRQFVAGLLEHARAMAVFGDPTTNAYARFRPYSFAPDRICWGADNRGALIRVQGGPGDAGTHVENRLSEPAANPYLWLAANIAAGLDGIDRGAEPPEPVEGDPYVADAPLLPQSLAEAVDELERQRVLPVGVRRCARRLPRDDEARRARSATTRPSRPTGPTAPGAAPGRCASTSSSTDVPVARARVPPAAHGRRGDRRRRPRLLRRPLAAPPRRLGHGVVAVARRGRRRRRPRAPARGRARARRPGVHGDDARRRGLRERRAPARRDARAHDRARELPPVRAPRRRLRAERRDPPPAPTARAPAGAPRGGGGRLDRQRAPVPLPVRPARGRSAVRRGRPRCARRSARALHLAGAQLDVPDAGRTCT